VHVDALHAAARRVLLEDVAAQVLRDELPLNPAGKVNKKALAARFD
jgi:acyl-CoA synthetase (AMP-forming)/AMP-acid ligase II